MKGSTFSVIYSTLFIFVLLTSLTEANLNHHKYKKTSHPNAIQGKYIIEVKDQPSVDKLVNELSLAFDSQRLDIRKKFKHEVFSGLTLQLKTSMDDQHQPLTSILDNDYVVAIYPSVIHQQGKRKNNNNNNNPSKSLNHTNYSYTPLTHPDDIKKALPHHLTQVDRVHRELGLTGKGIRVCVVDSGIDYNHPALGGGFGDGYKVKYGVDLIGDHYNATTNEYTPNPTPLDACDSFSATGHGTHVSGIIAAKYEDFVGVAPDVELGMYRVFDCEGKTSDDILLEAYLEADKADCDVINASLGEVNSWSETLDFMAISRLADKGRYFVFSAGNSGEEGLYTLVQPSTIRGGISIASFQNEYDIVKQFKATGIEEAIDFSSSTRGINTKYMDGELVHGEVSKKLAFNQTCHTPKDVKNKYVFLKVSNNDTCTLTERTTLLEKSGALAVIYYFEKDAEPVRYQADIPGLRITEFKYGDMINQQLKHNSKKKVHIQFTGQYAKSVKTVGKVSSFSSFGPTYELNIQPHLGGIGGRVYSTVPGYLNGWAVQDGTSMSAPYVSGCVALYLEYARKHGLQVSPEYIKEKFQNYALPVLPPPSNDTNHKSLLDTPLHQGAGLIQLYDAITKSVHVSPGAISFNDTASATEYKSHTLTIMNHGDHPVSYHIKNQPSYSINPYNLTKNMEKEKEELFIPNDITYQTLAAKLFMSQRTVHVQPHQSVQVKITVVPPKIHKKEDDHSFYGGFIYLQAFSTSSSSTSNSNQLSNKDISIPYFGAIGKQKDIPLFGPTFLINGTVLDPIPHNKTITFREGDPSLTIVNLLGMGTRYLAKEVVNKKTKQVIGFLGDPEYYIPRGGIESSPYKIFSFNGTYIPSSSSSSNKTLIPIPNGVYNIVYKALRIFGDINNPKDYDTWVSNDIIIKS